jgi:Na+/melibiose symporter-like transporter
MSDLVKPRELHGKRLLGYSLGDLGLTLPNMFTGVFLFQFYVYTVNLNALLVSIGVTFQLIIGSVFAIIFGVLVDNKKPGKYGKRRPFLLLGLPIWFITTILIWFPPYCPQGNSLYLPTASFFWIITIIRSIFRALIYNVYTSMLPEQSQTLKNREKLASISSAFQIIASIVALLLPLIVQSFLTDPANVKWWEPSGKLILFYIPVAGISCSIFGLITVILIFVSVDESFHNNDSNNSFKKVKVIDAFKRMSIPIKDKNYLKLIFAGFFTGVSGKIVGLLVFPFQTYVMRFQSAQFYIYIAISILGKFVWYFIWKKILKKSYILKSYSICLLFAIFGSFIDIFFLIGNLPYQFSLLLYILSWSTVLGSMYAFPLFSIPIMASLVHEAADQNFESTLDEGISKISGSYYGLSSFVNSMGPAFASIFVGALLSGNNEENPLAITIVFLSMALFYLVAFFFITRIKLSKNSYYSKSFIEKEKLLLE